ncbi:hypothetical protein QFC19_009201 [Naganishia cerealis]|uniref:Uncharacterized protein n=1 Tax=Naganishia cerealis TaxID=610337 RepID=A0ACC2UWC2_9TREE|nr:hypothetical protein QFC19_009201 [Naganishia cerealis]
MGAGRYYSERSYEKSRDSFDAELLDTASVGIDDTATASAVTSDSEYEPHTEGADMEPLRKRGRVQTPYRELSEEAAMGHSPGHESAL